MKEHIWNDVLNQKSVIYHLEIKKLKKKLLKNNQALYVKINS